MISITEKENNSIDMALEGELTIYVAEKLQQEISGYMEKHQSIELDLSQVTEMDTSCFQILLRAQLMSLKNNKKFAISNLSESSTQVFELYGLNNVFNLEENSTH